MNILFEEDGTFKAASIFSEADTTLMVELPSGKRSKIKSNTVRLRFDAPSPEQLMLQAQQQAREIELDFLWECAPQVEFKWQDLAQDYFGAPPQPIQAAALLMRLHSAPAYFYRKGAGVYRPAPAETLKAALAAIARKEQQEQQREQWSQALQQGNLPQPIASRARELLCAPDKNSMEYKALDAACHALGLAPARLLLQVGAFASAYEIHRDAFLFAHFPHGVNYPNLSMEFLQQRTALWQDLPLALTPAFSIDDESTTEVDDAFSVEFLNDGKKRVGIHIAAPALGLQPDDAVDVIARRRLSTVYTPGEKITMLSDEVVDLFSLKEGQDCPSLSLYLMIDSSSVIEGFETKIERVHISHNLRHNQLDEWVTQENLENNLLGNNAHAEFPRARELSALWPLAQALHKQREQVRGKPENNNRTDYNFVVQAGRVQIVPRKRGAPLDLIVAELMICANQYWGGVLHQAGFAAIYRTQQGAGAMKKTRMSSHAAPHEGLGVAQYAWSTSPLRRYPDMINQWQLLAHVQGQPPLFSQKSAELFSVINAFETTYAAYAEQQDKMERYWCLVWLQQQEVKQLSATVLRDEIARAQTIPLIIKLPTLQSTQMARGSVVVVDILSIDLLDLSLETRVVSVTAPVATPLQAVALDSTPINNDVIVDASAHNENAQPNQAVLGDERFNSEMNERSSKV